MRVLVTGSNGHVGGAIANHLAERGFEVVGLNRRRAELPSLAEQVQLDLAAANAAEHAAEAVAPCEAIVHAAARISKDDEDPDIEPVNVGGTERMLELARAWKAGRFIYASGVTVIGQPRDLPITEEHPTAATGAYLASKLAGERLLANGGVSGASLRITSPVGPGMAKNRILSVFVDRARAGEPLVLAGTGARRQNYVDVRDVAAAALAAIETQANGVFNIGGSEAISNRELAELCVRVLGSQSKITTSGEPDPEENLAWEVSIERARRELGYEPTHGIEDSIRAVASEVPAR